MDEASVAARVAQNIPQEPVAEVSTTPAPAQPAGDAGYANEMPFDEVTRYRMLERFQVPQNYWSDPQINSKLVFIYQWASDIAHSTEYIEVSAYLRRAEAMLGHNQSGIDGLYRYAKLDMQRRKIEQEMMYA